VNERKALLVAILAYILGAVGHVAFSMHDGNVTGLTLVRFPAGIGGWLFLNEVPTATQTALGALAVIFVVLMSTSLDDDRLPGA